MDNAASTQIHDDVLNSMLPFMNEQYGNTPHLFIDMDVWLVRAIEKARKQVASLINADPKEIFFTSGGTESNNLALNGLAMKHQDGRIITSSIEHDAILQPCKKLSRLGFDVVHVPVNHFGMVDLEKLHDCISEDTRLVSVMFGNNEVGTIQPISEIAKICGDDNIPFHTDAVQATGKIAIDVKDLGLDLLSISSHKINGPKGVGALYVKKAIDLDPLILGGGQEHGLRSGTENVANIVGFGKACEIAEKNLLCNISYLQDLKNSLVENVLKKIPKVTLNGDPIQRLPNNAHFTFLGINGEDLIIKLDEYGVAASTGSACSVNTQKASHVLESMGFSHEQITGSLRLTVGIFNNSEEIIKTIDILSKVVKELRSVSPYKEKYSFS